MTIQQLSVFIENKSGTLQKVLNLLKEAGIQLIASTIADTVEYGILPYHLLGTQTRIRDAERGRNLRGTLRCVRHHTRQSAGAGGRRHHHFQ